MENTGGKVESKESKMIKIPEKQLFIERVVSSLEFAKRTVQHLIIEGYAAPKDAPWYVRSEKIIAESAFLMVFANSVKIYEPVAKALSALAEVLEPLARSEAMLLNICLKPDLALDYGHSHICLSYLGYPNQKFDLALADSLASEAAGGIERTPYRMLEREWLGSIWKNAYNQKGLNSWISKSCLNHPVELFSESSDGVYALTHAIMYVTFEGKKVKEFNADQIIDLVEALLVRYMDKQDYDVAGELLMAWPLLGKQLSSTASFALNCLLKIEARVGFLPAPGLDRSMVEDKGQTERRTYIYSINYHTAFVMGLLCCTLLKNYNMLDVDDTTNFLNPPNLVSSLNSQLRNGKRTHWYEYYTKLDRKQQQRLVPFVYQACLVRNIQNRKYAKVAQMLQLSNDNGLGTLAMAKQAQALLDRLGRNIATKKLTRVG